MRIRFLLPLVGILLVPAGHPAHADASQPPGADILSRLQETARGYNTLQFAMDQDISVMGQSMRANGHVQSAGERMAMSMTMHMPNGMAMEQRTVTTADTAWTYMPMMNLVTKIDLNRVRAEAPDVPAAKTQRPFNFAGMLDAEQVEYLGPDTVDEVPTEHFALQLERLPLTQGQQMPGLPPGGRTEVWISSEDGMPRLLKIYDNAGNPMFTQRYHDIVINGEIPEETFAFTPPEGAQVVDMTDMLIQMAHGGAPPGISSTDAPAFSPGPMNAPGPTAPD